jgi:hypothetical protein
MSLDRDGYEAYYSGKLWGLIPEVYRADDAEGLDGDGPLREIVNRIGAQATIVRRSMDRLWDDQSIETSDDWVIPYIGDLLATNLVAPMGSRAQRLDVAKTVYYRRRKGTLGILEEIANDVTGWDARVVEFFRRLERTRHNLDPPIGWPADSARPDDAVKLQTTEGLVGSLTRTPMGGFADLRSTYGATRANSAFDEYFHTADVRAGGETTGWYGIPRLGVFLWRLRSFEVMGATPVPVNGCPDYFTFDPTGRSIPLFARASRSGASYGAQWSPPEEWQLPTAIGKGLLNAEGPNLYPESLAVPAPAGSPFNVVPPAQLTVFPACGSFRFTGATSGIAASYHYGFSSAIGAGPYDRRIGGSLPGDPPAPVTAVSGGGSGLTAALTGLGAGTVRISDSLTYDAVANVGTASPGIQHVRIDAENTVAFSRPCIRLPEGSEWSFTGASGPPGAVLELDGLLVSGGGDLVLRGIFDTVRINCCTLDPGTSGATWPGSPSFAPAADSRPLAPTRLWIEGAVRVMELSRSILGPILVRQGGHVETVALSDSIVQSIPTSAVLANPALGLDEASVALSRCTVLGPVAVQRLEASECILHEIARVGDVQHGCVRFSAWATGSMLPRKYESSEVAPGAPLFATHLFGRPGYGQLLPTADRAIVSSTSVRPSIREGGPARSEMGAFAREMTPIRLASLRIKLREFMPIGMDPVFINVT